MNCHNWIWRSLSCFFMIVFDMSFHVAFLWKTFLANITSVWFSSIMLFDMSIQVAFFGKPFLANSTCVSLFPFMNWLSVIFQITLQFKGRITFKTLKWPFSFMHSILGECRRMTIMGNTNTSPRLVIEHCRIRQCWDSIVGIMLPYLYRGKLTFWWPCECLKHKGHSFRGNSLWSISNDS